MICDACTIELPICGVWMVTGRIHLIAEAEFVNLVARAPSLLIHRDVGLLVYEQSVNGRIGSARGWVCELGQPLPDDSIIRCLRGVGL